MREMIKMVIVLTVLSSFSGGLLAALNNGLSKNIENQELEFVKGPAIRNILKGASNDPIVDRFKITEGKKGTSFFVGVYDGKADTVAFESTGKGFGGDIGLMVGVNVEEDKIINVGVTTHNETPGIGSNAKTDVNFSNQFKGLSIADTFKIKAEDGQIDAISGATVTSKGVCVAITNAGRIYRQLKPQIIEELRKYQK